MILLAIWGYFYWSYPGMLTPYALRMVLNYVADSPLSETACAYPGSPVNTYYY